MKLTIFIILAIGLIAILFTLYKSGHFFKNLFISCIQGVLSLIAVNVTGLATGVTLCLNWYTVGAVAILGLPGTIGLTVLKVLFR